MNKKYLMIGMSLIALYGHHSYAHDESSTLKKIQYQPLLQLNDFAANPFIQYSVLLKQMKTEGVVFPKAAVLSTLDENDHPNARTIGIKAVTDDGFVFYTNPTSNKAKQISDNPHVSLLVLWHNPTNHRSYQIRIQGLAEKHKPEKRITLDVNNQSKNIPWQAYIVKPNTVQFSLLQMHEAAGIIEYITYTKSKNQWIKDKKIEDYIAPGGC